MSKKILAVVMAAAMAMTGLAGCQGKGTSTAATGGDNGAAPSAEATKITICVPDPEASYIYQAAQEFAKRAEEYSGGTLTFTISGNGSLYGGASNSFRPVHLTWLFWPPRSMPALTRDST